IYDRGIGNGMEGLKFISKSEIKEIEPHVNGEQALWVPQAGIIDYPMVAQRLRELFENELGGRVVFNEKVVAINEDKQGLTIDTEKNSYKSAYVISCAGLHSVRITSLVDASNDLRIIPFKGCY